MNFGGNIFGEGTLAGPGYAVPSTAPPIGGEPEVEIIIDPFTIEIASISMKGHQLVNTLSIDVELGRQGSASFSLLNTSFVPEVGEPVRILFYDEVLFTGAIDRVTIETNNMQTYVRYNCECTDNSYLLFRNKIRMSFSNQSVSSIVDGVLVNNLSLDGVTKGVIDNNITIPIANADGVSSFEFLNGIAVATGTVFSIDNNKKLNFIGASLPAAPTPLTGENIEACSIQFDRETYRNWMTTKATGTPVIQGESPNIVELTRTNNEQINERANVELNSGIYNDMTSVTHPSSNNPVELTRLANANNKILLAVAGSIRRSITLRTRQYGYRAGQTVSVDVPQLGVTGEWVIQRLSLKEESGRFLISDMNLNQTSLLKRAQELWIDVVRKGTVTVMPPISIYTNSSFNAVPGSGSIQVPSGVTEMQISCYGAGGGGGGGAKSDWPNYGGVQTADGARGGGGGLVVGVITVTPGEILTFFVGTGGDGGPGEYKFESYDFSFGGNGITGTTSWVKRGSTYLVQAYGGDYGIGGSCRSRPQSHTTFPDARGGGGYGGQSITIGGAANGGHGGYGATYSPGGTGGHGRIVFEW